MIRAVMLDLDGTLIGRNETVSARVGEAVGWLSRRLPVSIATGREPADVLRYARQLGLASPQICDGGASILDPATGQPLWCNPLSPEQAEKIVQQVHSLKAAFVATHADGSITSITQVTHWNLTRVSALDMEEEAADELVASFISNQQLHVVKVYLPYNRLWAVDFTRNGFNKATATLKLAEMLGVETGQMAAAGDSYNDLPLLQVCGFRIAMGNAPPEVKAVADYVAPTAEQDGLAVAIEEFVLPRL